MQPESVKYYRQKNKIIAITLILTLTGMQGVGVNWTPTNSFFDNFFSIFYLFSMSRKFQNNMSVRSRFCVSSTCHKNIINIYCYCLQG